MSTLVNEKKGTHASKLTTSASVMPIIVA
jgi:hypothetical protein